jgi:hypothetical protein
MGIEDPLMARANVTSGLQIQSGAGPRPSAGAASVAGSQIEESVCQHQPFMVSVI